MYEIWSKFITIKLSLGSTSTASQTVLDRAIINCDGNFHPELISLPNSKNMFKLIIETLEKPLATLFHYTRVLIPVTLTRFFPTGCLVIILSTETTSDVKIKKK